MKFLLFLSSAFATLCFAQDTIRIMQYNLLHYGASNPPISEKNNRLKTIIGYVNPDIFGANEINNNALYSQNLLQNVLWALYGNNSWDKGIYTNYAQSDITNMLFFRSDKIGLKSQKTVTGHVRDMNIYNLYYYKTGYDTIFFTIAEVHLKAGKSFSYTRELMLQDLMDTLNVLNPKYLILMGDLNVYDAAETGFQLITNYSNTSLRLYDPANSLGAWNKNSAFADVHTQSTRTANIGDGGSTGGLNDRFDWILANSAFWDNTGEIKIISSSYTTVGQDGQHFNLAVNDPPANTSVPSNVLTDLYYMSDHLPVYCDFVFSPKVASSLVQKLPEVKVKYNSFVSDELVLTMNSETGKDFQIIIYDLLGQKHITRKIFKGKQEKVSVEKLPAGIYFFQVRQNEHNLSVYKFVKTK